MSHPCQNLCVDWWNGGSKVLAWQEKEMSVLASINYVRGHFWELLLPLFVILFVSCADSGRLVSRNALDNRVALGRPDWYYRGSDNKYHYIAWVMSVSFFPERRQYYKVERPELDDLLVPHIFRFNLDDKNSKNWKMLKFSVPFPGEERLTTKFWRVQSEQQ